MKLQSIATLALLLAGPVQAENAHAESLAKQLIGEWRSLCRKMPDNYMQVTSHFAADNSYTATTVFYGDAECKSANGLKIVSEGSYQLGDAMTTSDGHKARQLDIQVAQTRSGDTVLPGAGQRITQIFAIVDGRLLFGTAPTHLAITNGQRPQQLNKDFYSTKQ